MCAELLQELGNSMPLTLTDGLEKNEIKKVLFWNVTIIHNLIHFHTDYDYYYPSPSS